MSEVKAFKCEDCKRVLAVDDPMLRYTFGSIWKSLGTNGRAIIAGEGMGDAPPVEHHYCVSCLIQLVKSDKNVITR